MIPTYIINLKKNIERKNTLASRLEVINKNKLLNVIWTDAVDGQLLKSNPDSLDSLDTLKFQIDTTWVEPTHRKPLTCGEVGCALSHWNIWKQIAESDYPYGLILEDDIILMDNFESNIKSYLDLLPPDTSMAYVYRKALNRTAEVPVNKIWARAKKSYWNCAYVITKRGADQLLRSLFINAIIPVDEFLPMLYDTSCRSNPFKYVLESDFATYAIRSEEICNIDDTVAFSESNTFHSPSYVPLSTNLCIYTIVSDLIYLEHSAMSRFKYSCETYGIPYVILTNPSNQSVMSVIKNHLESTDHSIKYILFLDYNSSMIGGNPYEIINLYLEIVNDDENILLYPVLNFMPDKSKSSGFMCTIKTFDNPNIDTITQIDYSCALFQNIENSCGTEQNVGDTNFDLHIIKAEIQNKKYDTKPKILLSGNNKLYFNSIENYTLYGHKQKYGFKLDDLKETPLVDVYVYLLQGKSVRCLRNLAMVSYPSDRMRVFVISYSNIKITEVPKLSVTQYIQISPNQNAYDPMMQNVKTTDS